MSTEAATSRNAETLKRFSDAWARGDVDALLGLMTEEPTYRASVGARPGAVYHGREEVRAAFNRLFAGQPLAGGPPPSGGGSPSPAGGSPPSAGGPLSPTPGEAVFAGNRALTFWVLPGRAPDGSPANVEGVDVMTFDERGRIAVKDAYRKSW